MKKRAICLILSLVLFVNLSSSINATTTAPTLSEITPIDQETLLSDMTELECLEFIKSQGVDIPDDFEDETRWAPFIKQTIQRVEEDPNCVFAYNYIVTLQFAEDIRNVVNEYYTNHSYTLDTISTNTASAIFKVALEDSTNIGPWYDYYANYNCYAYAVGKSDKFYQPGEKSGRTYSLSLDLNTLVNYVKYDLAAFGYPCIEVTTTRPTAYIDGDAKAIAFRIGDTDFHFMKLDKSDGRWYHKPGETRPLKYNYLPTTSRQWTNECIKKLDHVYIENTYYTSEIYYYIFAPHEYIYTYVGSGSHTVSCLDCSAYKFESCSPVGNCAYCGY